MKEPFVHCKVATGGVLEEPQETDETNQPGSRAGNHAVAVPPTGQDKKRSTQDDERQSGIGGHRYVTCPETEEDGLSRDPARKGCHPGERDECPACLGHAPIRGLEVHSARQPVFDDDLLGAHSPKPASCSARS